MNKKLEDALLNFMGYTRHSQDLCIDGFLPPNEDMSRGGNPEREPYPFPWDDPAESERVLIALESRHGRQVVSRVRTRTNGSVWWTSRISNDENWASPCSTRSESEMLAVAELLLRREESS